MANKRQGSYEIPFTVLRHEASGAGKSSRRRLAGSEAPGSWGGYDLQTSNRKQVLASSVGLESSDNGGGSILSERERLVDRFIGPRPGANRVLGGMMLYLHRQGVNLTFVCSRKRVRAHAAPRMRSETPLCINNEGSA